MQKLVTSVLIATASTFLTAVLSYLGSSTTTKAKSVLNPLASVQSQDATTTTFFKSALRAANIPGGIVTLSQCKNEMRHTITPSDSSLRSVLDAIVVADPQYKWVDDNGVINLIPRGTEPAILNIRIAKVNIKNAETVHQALDELMSLPELRKRASELNSGSQVFRGGLGYFDSSKRDKNGNAKQISIVKANTTLREVLNDIARVHGSAVWSYTEYQCGSNAYSLSFLPQ